MPEFLLYEEEEVVLVVVILVVVVLVVVGLIVVALAVVAVAKLLFMSFSLFHT